MLEIKRSSLPLDELIRSPDYAPLINSLLMSKLLAHADFSNWIAAEARVNGVLAALALAEIYPHHRLSKLESLEISESFMGQGIWRSLFTFMQEFLCHEKKMRGMEWTYDQGSSTAPAIEKILVSLGWPKAELYLMRLHFDALTFNPPWIHRPFRLPPDMHMFPWSKLLPKDKEQIAYLCHQGRCLPFLSPLRMENSIDLETSVGLRKNGTLVGWSVTRRPDPSTILYASLYVESDLLRSGHGIQLLIESIRRHKALPIPHALLELNLQTIDPSWWQFVNRRLIPLASQIERIKQTYHVFQQNL